jgi:hypothetical protein
VDVHALFGSVDAAGIALTGGPFDNGRAGGAWVFTPPAPSCVNVASTTAAGGGASAVQLSCAGVAGAALSYAIVAQPGHGRRGTIDQGSGRVTYTPQSRRAASADRTLSHTRPPISDQWGDTSNLAMVTIAIPPAVPTCTDTTARAHAGGGQVTVTLLCTAPPGVPLSDAILTSPAHGVVSAVNQTNGQVNYLSNSRYTGPDAFTYRAGDSGGASNAATAMITVPPAPPTPVASIIGLGDTAANTMHAALDVNATSPRLQSGLHWISTFSIPPGYSVFTSMVAQTVAIGTRINLSCDGRGCPFAKRIVKVTASTRCRRKTCAPTHPHTTAQSRSVDLTALLHGARLHIGARLAIRFQKRLYIGEIDVFTFRTKGPHLSKACLPPGRNAPAPRC